ncbi:MAG: D-aminoacyl-tRNA deacylase [Candidatus ainarchaeum sp.]|nr:D-aminoacyl-tRNA deacylase [Candidatus ainarchaeum sp.]
MTTNNQNLAIVYSNIDQAGINIINELKKLNCKLPIYAFDEESIFINLDKLSENQIIFVTKHMSKAEKKSLTVHSIGNFDKAEFGGLDKKLVLANPKLAGIFLRNLEKYAKELNLKEYEICYEVTHHGPYSEKLCIFIEVGGTEKEWSDLEACKIIAKTILESINKENKDLVAIGLGGGHYAPEFSKVTKRTNISFGHICPKYNLENLTFELLNEMIEKSNANLIVIDYKGLGKEKEKIKEFCEKIKLEKNIETKRTDKLKIINTD